MKQLATLDAALAAAPLDAAVEPLREALRDCLATLQHGDAAQWQAALDALPDVRPGEVRLDSARVSCGRAEEIDSDTRGRMLDALQQLHPWRKGPFELFGIHIDSEWRSDWKWERISRHVSPLAQRRVLDVGCGNGYYAWRMLGAGARHVLGVDPTLRFLAQFWALQRYIADPRVLLLPMRGEDLPARLGCFDTVFSMGVLYHRRSPFDHLAELLGTLRPGGELVLETLVIPGESSSVLVPQDRYARMRNVWFLPSPEALLLWLGRAGFADARLADLSATSVDEQRSTPWMRFESLADFLDPADATRTIEGYPAPLRALLIARRPG
jgi:tRNA (mo5U34)-methyltransferase